MSSEVHVPYNCLYFLIVDNIGFKDIANHDPTKIGTLQCTQLIDVVIQQDELIAAGILSQNGELLLSSVEFDADHQAELSLSDVLQLDIYRLNADVWERDRYTKPIEI